MMLTVGASRCFCSGRSLVRSHKSLQRALKGEDSSYNFSSVTPRSRDVDKEPHSGGRRSTSAQRGTGTGRASGGGSRGSGWPRDSVAPGQRGGSSPRSHLSRGRFRTSGEEDEFHGPTDHDGDRGDHLYPERRSKQSLLGDLYGEPLYGVAPVLAALRLKRRTIHALYLQETMDLRNRKDGTAVKEAIDLVKQRGGAVHQTSKHELNMMADNRPHQGLVLDCSPLEWHPMDTLPDVIAGPSTLPSALPPPVWLALDEVMDPQNLGAIVRSAHCLGVEGVLACSKNCAPLSAVASKASAGVLEAVAMYSTRNMPRTLGDAAAKGWLVLGASGETGATPSHHVVVDRPTILVMGNEGYGLRTNVRRTCSELVKIDMAIPAELRGVVDSLNVSVATGILLQDLIRSRNHCHLDQMTRQ